MAWVRHMRCNQPNNLTELIYLNFKIFGLAFRLVVSECSSQQGGKIYT